MGAPTTVDASTPGGTLDRTMSTRKLILAALLCGVVILVAFTVQMLMIT
jgi:hypothetical protein